MKSMSRPARSRSGSLAAKEARSPPGLNDMLSRTVLPPPGPADGTPASRRASAHGHGRPRHRRRRSVASPGMRLARITAVDHHGDLAGPTVVFVHGAPDRAASFKRVLALLGDLHVVTYDRRGYGRSV